ncbi:MAG: DUF342 domain-containing protein [Nitrosomonadales bacterium]|nr:DUF342 domain-containing protein [Nitrosomonadales bacterium]
MSTPTTIPEDHVAQPDNTLPAYVHVRPDGVYIAVSPPPAQDILQTFVDRLFNNNAYFKGLNYALFLDLLYGAKPVTVKAGQAPEVRLASDIVTFPARRKSAEEDGVIPIVEYAKKTEAHPTKLDFDEFVAEMWLKGVRFGIKADAVRAAIQSSDTTRIEIAVQREPTESTDAQIVEEHSRLRQDRSPLILSSGRAVLSTAKNFFPQVAKDEALLRKVPRTLGDPGYLVTGSAIEPRLPKDLDLQRLAGPGTRVEYHAQGDLIVAAIDGFLRFDDISKKVEVTPTIENRSGISAKSTGDIKLDVDEFVEHGEVQEGRFVKGKHLTFRSAVYGTVLANGGNIVIDDNLSGGEAKSIGGDIAVHGRSYNANLEAWDGTITIKFAESCAILAKSVKIERAVNCEIVAENVQMDSAEGCAIAGMDIGIAATQARRDRETVITVLLPDCSGLESQIAAARDEIAKIEGVLQSNAEQMEKFSADPKQAKLIDLGAKIRNGQIQLTSQQQNEWQKIFAQFPPAVKDTLVLQGKIKDLSDQIAELTRQIEASSTGQRCIIKEVLGDTVGQTLTTHLGVAAFRNLSRQELKTRLSQIGASRERIFSGWQGHVEWQFQGPEFPDN